MKLEVSFIVFLTSALAGGEWSDSPFGLFIRGAITACQSPLTLVLYQCKNIEFYLLGYNAM
jgi:hypothetical protein